MRADSSTSPQPLLHCAKPRANAWMAARDAAALPYHVADRKSNTWALPLADHLTPIGQLSPRPPPWAPPCACLAGGPVGVGLRAASGTRWPEALGLSVSPKVPTSDAPTAIAENTAGMLVRWVTGTLGKMGQRRGLDWRNKAVDEDRVERRGRTQGAMPHKAEPGAGRIGW